MREDTFKSNIANQYKVTEHNSESSFYERNGKEDFFLKKKIKSFKVNYTFARIFR